MIDCGLRIADLPAGRQVAGLPLSGREKSGQKTGTLLRRESERRICALRNAPAAPRKEIRNPQSAIRNLAAIFASKLYLLLAAMLASAGCCAAPCPDKLASIDQIVAAHNANAASVPRLWARVEMDVTLKPETGPEMTWRSGSPTGLLLYRRGMNSNGPHDFVLIGREAAAVELFRAGASNAQGLYYFWYKFGDRAGAWYGRLALAGAPGVKQVPVDPMQLLSVLGITPLPAEAGRLPAAAISMQNTPGDCAYVVAVLDRQPVSGRVLFKREIVMPWSDDKPPRPARVNIFDDAGRRVMTASLWDYKPIDVSSLDDPPAKSPVMPTDIDIVCNEVPGSHTFVRRIRLRISEMTVEDKWLTEAVDFHPPQGVVPVLVDAAAARGLMTKPASQPASQPATQPATHPAGAQAGNSAKRGDN